MQEHLKVCYCQLQKGFNSFELYFLSFLILLFIEHNSVFYFHWLELIVGNITFPLLLKHFITIVIRNLLLLYCYDLYSMAKKTISFRKLLAKPFICFR